MTQRSNHLRNTPVQGTHGPRIAARASAMREGHGVTLRGRLLAIALALVSIITVLVLITSPTSAEYGFV